MGIREDIMTLHDNHHGDSFDIGKNLRKLVFAANLAEARERELLKQLDSQANAHNQYTLELSLQISAYEKERAQMIAELRDLVEYDQGAHEYYPVNAEHLILILDRNEVDE
jgi:hypothetical protein